MFRSSRQIQYHPVGMDVGADAVKLLQLRTVAGVTEVAAAARVLLAQGDAKTDWVKQVRSAWRRGRFIGRRVVAALPRTATHVRALRLPPGDLGTPEAFLTAAEREAALTFGFPLTVGNVAYLPAGEVRQGSEPRSEVVAIATVDHDVEEFLGHLHRAGLVADSLDAAPCALYRAACRAVDAGPDNTAVTAVLDLGASAAQLVIGRGQTLCVVKTIDGGSRHLDAALSRRLDISLEDARALRRRTESTESSKPAGEDDRVGRAVHDALRAAAGELIEQVVLCLRYHAVSFRGTPPQQLWITGGDADSARLRGLLASGIGLPVEPLPLNVIIDPDALQHLEPTAAMGEWAVALGLAAKSLPCDARRQAAEVEHV